MGPDGVVFFIPYSDGSSGMVEAVELVHAQTFVAEFLVEGLHVPGSLGLSGGVKTSAVSEA